MKTKLCLLILLIVGLSVQLSANPINGLLERIDKGASKKFVIEFKKGADDFFELDQKGTKVVVRGNNYVKYRETGGSTCGNFACIPFHDSWIPA